MERRGEAQRENRGGLGVGERDTEQDDVRARPNAAKHVLTRIDDLNIGRIVGFSCKTGNDLNFTFITIP